MKRSRSAPGGRSPRLRISSIWCIVGTAEYQVARLAAMTCQKVIASNFGGTITVPPEAKVAMVEAISPWMWKSGITHIAASDAVSPYVRAMLSAE